MVTKLYVGNLSFNTSEGELRQAFAAHGTVTSCNVVMDRMTDRPRGFAFVEMASADEAQKAIAALNGQDLGGRPLVVNEARPREDRPRGGGGSGGGYGGGNGGGNGDGYGGGRRNRY
jgi:RNA recognition motif-containing protein